MKISVIIPLYNKSDLISLSLNSVINQIVTPDEIIIVNDGSTDNSVDIVKSIMSENPSLNIKLIEQNNQGVSAARNTGVKYSSYDNLCFLDADDIWDENFIKKMLYLLNTYTDAVLYSLGHEIIKGDGRFPVKVNHGCGNKFIGYVDDFFKRSLKGCVAKSSKVCVKKDAFNKVGGFPEGVTAGEDLLVWIKLALIGRVACDTSVYCKVYQIEDNSRIARINSLPYPLVYFSDGKKFKTLPFHAKNYISLIGIKHQFSSLLNGDFYLFINRFVLTCKFSFFRAIFPFYLYYLYRD